MSAPMWGSELPKEVMEMQRRLNAMESQMLETRGWWARPRWFDTRPIYSPWWAMAVLMTALLLMSWCVPARVKAEVGADDPTDAVERYDARLAAHRLDRYRVALGFASPISISVESDSQMPRQADGQRVDAHTTRAWAEGGPAAGCTVHVTRLSVQRASVLAHEACHCTLDYEVLGAWGYVGVSKDERRRRERAASECEDRLMARGPW